MSPSSCQVGIPTLDSFAYSNRINIEHPGGQKIILKYAGKDATEEFDPIHPPDTLDKYLDKSKHLGEVDMSTVEQEEKAFDPEEADRLERVKRMPSLAACYNLMDFEAVARQVMKKTAWAYYSSGADDEIVCHISTSSTNSNVINGRTN
jgi:L-lactate dehydrogenase (cytochrome)